MNSEVSECEDGGIAGCPSRSPFCNLHFSFCNPQCLKFAFDCYEPPSAASKGSGGYWGLKIEKCKFSSF